MISAFCNADLACPSMYTQVVVGAIALVGGSCPKRLSFLSQRRSVLTDRPTILANSRGG